MHISLPQSIKVSVWIECEKYPKTRSTNATEVIDTEKNKLI